MIGDLVTSMEVVAVWRIILKTAGRRSGRCEAGYLVTDWQCSHSMNFGIPLLFLIITVSMISISHYDIR